MKTIQEKNGSIKNIMLIDDNKFDNFYHQRVLSKFDPELKLYVYDSSIEALEYLINSDMKEHPDYIFLDINMPGLNGWEFIHAYLEKVSPKGKTSNLILLSTSQNQDDIEKARSIGVVYAYVSKPLMVDTVKSLLTKQTT